MSSRTRWAGIWLAGIIVAGLVAFLAVATSERPGLGGSPQQIWLECHNQSAVLTARIGCP